MNSIKNLEHQQCRVCYDSTSDLQLLTNFAEYSTSHDKCKTYGQLLLEVCDINVIEDKPLGYWPSFICSNCRHKLQWTQNFIQRTRKINRLLKSIADLFDNRNKTNIIENPELDIPLNIERENDESVFHSAVEPQVMKAKSSIVTFDPLNIEMENDDLSSESVFHSTAEPEVITAESSIVTRDENILGSNYNEDKKIHIIVQDHADTIEIITPKSKKSPVKKSKKSISTEDLTCKVCNKKYTSIPILRRHKLNVHGLVKRKFSCHLCVLNFNRSDTFHSHLERVHKLNMQPTTENITNKLKISNTVAASSHHNENSKANNDDPD